MAVTNELTVSQVIECYQQWRDCRATRRHCSKVKTRLMLSVAHSYGCLFVDEDEDTGAVLSGMIAFPTDVPPVGLNDFPSADADGRYLYIGHAWSKDGSGRVFLGYRSYIMETFPSCRIVVFRRGKKKALSHKRIRSEKDERNIRRGHERVIAG